MKLERKLNLLASIATVFSFVFFVATYTGLLPDRLNIGVSGHSIFDNSMTNLTWQFPLTIIFLVLTIVFMIPILIYILKKI